MNFQKNLTKKIFFIIMVFILSFNFSFFATPKKAEAIFGVADTAIVLDPVVSAQLAGKTIWDKLEAYTLRFFSIAVRIFAKTLINNITQATVSWINGGMQGQPAFKSDFHKFMTAPGGVNDQVMGQFFQNNGLNFLCSPFQLQVKLALQLGYGAGLQQKIGCTLTQMQQNASNALTNSSISASVDVNGNVISGGVHDFRNQNGWNEWLSTTMQPQNNPEGAYLTAKSELDSQITIAGQTKQLDFLTGNGALSFKRCVDKYQDVNGNIIWTSPEYTSGAGEKGKPVPSAETLKNAAPDGIYSDCSVKTPGSVITGTLNKVSGSGIDQLGLTSTLSDGLDAVLGALINYEMSKLQKGILDSNQEGYNNYHTALNSSYTTALDTYNTDLSSLYNDQTDFNNTDWTNPNITLPTFPTTPTIFSTSTFSLSTTTWVWDPITGDPFVYSTSTDYSLTTWNYDPTTGIPISSTLSTPSTIGTGYSALDQAKNNSLILINSLLKSESAYQNNYLIAQNVLSQGKAVFATSSACNISYNRNDSILRSLLIRANVITNIDGVSDSNRTIASIPWNLEIIKVALANSTAKITLLNKASSDVNGASSITAVTDAMTPVNSASFDTDPQVNLVDNVKTWLRGVGSIYNSLICPIDLTKVLQITTSTSTVK